MAQERVSVRRCEGPISKPQGRRSGVEEGPFLVPFFEGQGSLMNGSSFSVILLPTLRCNADCDYCFEKKSEHHLTLDKLSVVVQKVMDHLEQDHVETLSIYWQGGEVMTLPPAWFEEANGIIHEIAD